ncbi:hypothetical protein Syun_003647 [Stephania yunnanensis]|uniref:Uncharacterized protein n=1 Tax=Stephania yunnanensis TaxID=152371 RepID=A0AAP0Q0S4_9MAGN
MVLLERRKKHTQKLKIYKEKNFDFCEEAKGDLCGRFFSSLIQRLLRLSKEYKNLFKADLFCHSLVCKKVLDLKSCLCLIYIVLCI